MKQEAIWWVAAFAISILITGIVTGFRFDLLDIQLHDAYYVFDSYSLIKGLTAIFIFCRYFHLLIELLVNRSVLFAFLVSLVNPIGGLLVLLFFYQLVSVLKIVEVNPIQNGGTLLLVLSLVLILGYQIILEAKALKKLKHFLKKES